MAELDRIGLLDTSVKRNDGLTLKEALNKYDIMALSLSPEAESVYRAAPGGGGT